MNYIKNDLIIRVDETVKIEDADEGHSRSCETPPSRVKPKQIN